LKAEKNLENYRLATQERERERERKEGVHVVNRRTNIEE
jgi:hypothetical protein